MKTDKIILCFFAMFFLFTILVLLFVVYLYKDDLFQKDRSVIVNEIKIIFLNNRPKFESLRDDIININKTDSIVNINISWNNHGAVSDIYIDKIIKNQNNESIVSTFNITADSIKIDTIITNCKIFNRIIKQMEELALCSISGNETVVLYHLCRSYHPYVLLNWKKNCLYQSPQFKQMINNYYNKDKKYWISVIDTSWYIESQQGFD